MVLFCAVSCEWGRHKRQAGQKACYAGGHITHKTQKNYNDNILTELYIEIPLFPSYTSLHTGENLFRKSSGFWSSACRAELEESKYG